MCACAAYMCMSTPRPLITSGVIWALYDWLNKFYSFYMAAVVIINSECCLRLKACCRNQPNKSKVVLYMYISCYFHFNSSFKELYIRNKMEHFSYKGGWVWMSYTYHVFNRRAGLGYK